MEVLGTRAAMAVVPGMRPLVMAATVIKEDTMHQDMVQQQLVVMVAAMRKQDMAVVMEATEEAWEVVAVR